MKKNTLLFFMAAVLLTGGISGMEAKVRAKAPQAKTAARPSDKNLISDLEQGVRYAFSPQNAKQAEEGVKLLRSAGEGGLKEAWGYLGFYYFNKKDYKQAKECFDKAESHLQGFAYTALGSMYMEGNGVKEDVPKARECYHQAALRGYSRGATLYGLNLRATGGGPVNYPDSFFWLYIAGDLGENAARVVLQLPKRADGSGVTTKDAQTALEYVEAALSGSNFSQNPLYKDGFLPSLKMREQAAEQGDDWARFYLGSMNYNGDFLSQNFAQAARYYEAIAANDRLPANVLAIVHARLADMYRTGNGVAADPAKAAEHAQKAAAYGA